MTILTGTTEIKKRYITRCSPGRIIQRRRLVHAITRYINEQRQIFYNLILMNPITNNYAALLCLVWPAILSLNTGIYYINVFGMLITFPVILVLLSNAKARWGTQLHEPPHTSRVSLYMQRVGSHIICLHWMLAYPPTPIYIYSSLNFGK